MRIAKRVLAIVLSIVMVVGSFAIATSAADDAKVYVTLKAQVMTGTGASESVTLGVEDACPASVRNSNITAQRADVTTYTASKDSLTYYDNSSVIEVNPGDMIWVTTNLRSTGGIYPEAVQGQVFYDTGLFTSVAMSVTQCYQWNADNEIGKYTNTTLSGGALWGRIADDSRLTYSAYAGTENEDKYHYYHWFAAADASAIANDTECIEAQNSDLVTFPIYVKPDAEPGTTGTIFTVAHDKLKGSYYPATDYSGDAGDVYETPVAIPTDAWDVSAATLNFVVAGGEEETLDYTEIDAQIAEYESCDGDVHTTETWAAATTAYNAAVSAKETATTQEELDTAAAALKEALANLEEKVVLDYTAIDNAIASVPADLSGYTTSTANAASTALAAAESVKASATTQAELDEAATALNSAVAALEAKANFANLNSAIDEATSLTNIGYTEETWSALESALATAQSIDQDETGISQQATVNAAYDAIIDAIDGLVVEKLLDYTNWNNAVANIPADLAIYTPASVSAYETAKASAESAFSAAVDAGDQDALDAAASALQAAIDSLVLTANKEALQAAIADTPEYDAEVYGDTWAAYEDALAAANDVNDDVNATQDAVDAATEALVAAKAALEIAPADYSAVEEAIDMIPSDLEFGYTDETVAAVEDAVNAVDYSKTILEQEEVDAMADAIIEAINLLDRIGDYSVITDAESAIPADLSIYTDESVQAVRDAQAAVVYGLGLSQQATIQGYADAISEAVANLEEKDADYTAVDAALAKVEALNRALYTTASLDDVDYAVSQVVEGKKISAQAEVDAMAEAIETALAALQLKPTEGYVQEVVATTDTPYAANTFTIKVTGRPNKVRFVDVNNTDLTVTFSREAARAVGSIVSYNDAGEAVNDLSRDIAYEIWTVEVAFNAGTYYVNAKDNDGWEALEISYIFEYKYSTDDKAVSSIEAPNGASAAPGAEVALVVKTGTDVLKVRTVVNGVEATFADRSVADGVATFEVYAKAYNEGENVVSFQIKTADGWETIDETFSIYGENPEYA